MVGVICFVSDAMVDIAALPDFSVAYNGSCPERKTALDKLKCTLQRHLRRKQDVEMVWHEHEFVKLILSLSAVAVKGV